MMAGRWALNADESDDVEREISRGTRARAVARVKLPFVTGNPPRSSVTPRVDPTAREATALLKYVERDVSTLALILTDSTATVISSDFTVVLYHTDGPGTAILGDGVEVRTQAEWRGGELRLEARVDGGRIEEKYEIDEGTGSLKVETRLIWANRGLNIRIRRTYDRVPDGG